MAKGNYVAGNDNAFSMQLQKFKLNIPSYSATVGVSADQVASQAADADYFDYCLKSQAIMQDVASNPPRGKTSCAMAAPRRPRARP